MALVMKPEYLTSDFWDIIWSRKYSNYIKHHQFLWDEIKDRSFGTILDLGCGSSFMWKGYSPYITGVDFSKEAIDQSLINNPNGTYYVSSLEKIPLDKKYDTVILCGVINYFKDLNNLRKEATRLCGNQIIVTINMLKDFPDREWNRDTIEKEFSKWGFVREMILFPGIAWLIRIAV